MHQHAIEQRRERRSDAMTVVRPPFISVIVPVRNEEAFIADTLQQLLTQRYDVDRFEVLVADGRSTDETRTIIAALQTRYANLRLLDSPRCWSSAGRNVAVRASGGEIILLVDGHCELNNPNYLQNLAAAFAVSGADCVGRPQPLNVTGANLVQRGIAAARASRLGHHPASHIYSEREDYVPPQSVAVAYRRGVFDTVGLFDERFDACEDVEFNHRVARAGLTCWFTPRVAVRYYPRSSLSGLFRQMMRYGRGRVRLLRKYPETFSLFGFVPAAFVAGVLAGLPLACWSPLLAIVYLSVLTLYAATVLMCSLLLCLRRREPRLLLVLPLIFPAIHIGAGAGVWSELLMPLQPKRADSEEEAR